jgi:hypothetical protein
MSDSSECFPASLVEIVGGLDGSELVHLVVKSCGSHWASLLQNAQLILREDLRTGESLVRPWLPQIGRAHHWLRHHQVVGLRPSESFLAVNGPDAQSSSYLAN